MFNIIPQPVSILINRDKKGFTLHAGTIISPYDFSQDFILFVRNVFNKKVRIHEDTGEEKSIILKIDNSIQNDEGYTLKCENRRVYINAKTEAGLFYGLQTLKQMLVQSGGKVPYTEIIDEPRFSHRGVKLDFRKNAYSVDEIKRIIDLMALHKLNVLRWCDDENHYTQKALKEIVAYCQAKKIKVITEQKIDEKINSNDVPYRFDYPYGMNTLKKVCNDDGALTENNEETLGIEACVCTDYIPDMKRFEFLTFPRLSTMAENAWADKGYPTFTTFLHKAEDYFKFLDAYEVNFAPIKKACPSFIYKHASTLLFKCKNFKNK